jgi:catechol-2,3-dioxygenase
MKISGLGHVALKVTDIERSKQFYHGILGMPYSGDYEGKSMVFFRSDEHHNLALFQVDSLDNSSPSLDHIALRLEGGLAELSLAQSALEAANIDVTTYEHSDQQVSSLYFNDPDRNQIELYVRLSD